MTKITLRKKSKESSLLLLPVTIITLKYKCLLQESNINIDFISYTQMCYSFFFFVFHDALTFWVFDNPRKTALPRARKFLKIANSCLWAHFWYANHPTQSQGSTLRTTFSPLALVLLHPNRPRAGYWTTGDNHSPGSYKILQSIVGSLKFVYKPSPIRSHGKHNKGFCPGFPLTPLPPLPLTPGWPKCPPMLRRKAGESR